VSIKRPKLSELANITRDADQEFLRFGVSGASHCAGKVQKQDCGGGAEDCDDGVVARGDDFSSRKLCYAVVGGHAGDREAEEGENGEDCGHQGCDRVVLGCVWNVHFLSLFLGKSRGRLCKHERNGLKRR